MQRAHQKRYSTAARDLGDVLFKIWRALTQALQSRNAPPSQTWGTNEDFAPAKSIN